ncbi:MAG: phage holin family protein [Chloroflexota bacterium]
MRFLIRWITVAIALFVTASIMPGINIQGTSGWISVTIMALVLGLVNAFIRPILTFLSCGLLLVTLGLFMFVINAITFWLSAWIATNWFNAGFSVDSFWAALWGSIVVSIISFLISLVLPDFNSRS